MTNKSPTGTKIKREIEVKLTESEIAMKWKQGVSLTDQISHLETERAQLLKTIHSKKERRTVELTAVTNTDTKKVEFWHKVFGEWQLVDSRPMTDGEAQFSLPIEAPKAKRGRKPKPKLPVAAHANGSVVTATA